MLQLSPILLFSNTTTRASSANHSNSLTTSATYSFTFQDLESGCRELPYTNEEFLHSALLCYLKNSHSPTFAKSQRTHKRYLNLPIHPRQHIADKSQVLLLVYQA